ncbi:hypothetical protein C7408_102245 [Paraburkholderia caballeronis]|uniref:Uncharacterized protein n=1 Tax=Paraburkholderia caballeronis TaxID=416943 RepID=A0A1H7LJD0_9BURK|nr:hypothetical protein C7403_102380 [Paraburkholderia caballeronis]PXX03852.1 hypothetical protein C7407_102380 [Paraburkholderia caballeronis]RAK04596.1 hypothetical protein C7409_102380 [Paraburkholderia caballeronis]TDV19500.1 hypothetical protein C7408_102245 [Paraburkholderia caballeronis]TDV22100.1 hypothetical protein C7406_101245 [Paraburkholderia caballeronis]
MIRVLNRIFDGQENGTPDFASLPDSSCFVPLAPVRLLFADHGLRTRQHSRTGQEKRQTGT